MMKKSFIALLAALMLAPALRADRGMWLPALIGTRIKDMRSKGFRLSAEDIYSVNKASLKDAVVLFNGGCTGELVSGEGLLLTNHHCGYGAIQSHSSVRHDYLTDGFWAMNRSEELPNPGLYVSFLVRMEDVTAQVLDGVRDDLPEARRDSLIRFNAARVADAAVRGTDCRADVEPFFYGNQYFLFVYRNYTDVRLVAAPPSSIGKFGGDTDNWMWPRHTGDFSLFRIYAGPDNAPADYSKDNVPFRPRRSLAISMRGLREGDFTFIYGFPGQTQQYVLSDAVDYLLNRGNPHKIALRTMRLDIMSEEQAKDADTRIRYASKHASVANAWKKWQGESRGLERLGTLGKKREQESRFDRWAASHPQYTGLLACMPSWNLTPSRAITITRLTGPSSSRVSRRLSAGCRCRNGPLPPERSTRITVPRSTAGSPSGCSDSIWRMCRRSSVPRLSSGRSIRWEACGNSSTICSGTAFLLHPSDSSG